MPAPLKLKYIHPLGYSSGQRGRTVNPLAFGLRRFEPCPQHSSSSIHGTSIDFSYAVWYIGATMSQEQEVQSIKSKALAGEFAEKLMSRSSDDLAVLSEVLLRELYREEPFIAPKAISALINGVVDSDRIFNLILSPSRVHLNDMQEAAVSFGTFLYALYRAEKSLSSLGVEVTTQKVFGWLREMMVRHLEEDSKRVRETGSLDLDPLLDYKEQAIAVLAELARVESAPTDEGKPEAV